MKKRTLIFCILLTLLTGVVLAEDTIIFDAPGGANDPAVNEDANACFRGGSLAGKCSSTDVDFDEDVDDFDRAWMWTCGWYLIRFEESMIDRETLQGHHCESILPPIVSADENNLAGGGAAIPPYPGAPAGCYFNVGVGLYLNWGGGTGPAGLGTSTYADPACGTPSGTALVNYVAADTVALATALCGSVPILQPHTPNPPGGQWYGCS